ncbi:unnamed protein product [Discosporangium mesarthrocarpum]
MWPREFLILGESGRVPHRGHYGGFPQPPRLPCTTERLLDGSGGQRDLDMMLALLRAEDRQNSKVKKKPDGSKDSDTGFNPDHLATPCI